MLLLLMGCGFAIGEAVAHDRWVSFWYGPASYGGSDINATLNMLSTHRKAVTSVMVYCGHTVASDRITLDSNSTPGLCLDPAPGRDALFAGMKKVGVKPELCLNGGNSNISDYRRFFANAEENVADMVKIGKTFGAAGWNMDLEPQVGSPSSTAADAVLYAAFCTKARAALNAAGMRLTIAVAQWSPMLSAFSVLAPTVDRLLDMETYSANSMAGWLNGDAYGGYYTKLLAPDVPRSVAGPGLECWPAAKCGGAPCWSTTAASAAERMDRIASDGVPEVALFRIVAIPNANMPQDFWWPLLEQFLAGSNSSSSKYIL
jgi:hypothetical protein